MALQNIVLTVGNNLVKDSPKKFLPNTQIHKPIDKMSKEIKSKCLDREHWISYKFIVITKALIPALSLRERASEKHSHTRLIVNMEEKTIRASERFEKKKIINKRKRTTHNRKTPSIDMVHLQAYIYEERVMYSLY
jgi:hypothetical protein